MDKNPKTNPKSQKETPNPVGKATSSSNPNKKRRKAKKPSFSTNRSVSFTGTNMQLVEEVRMSDAGVSKTYKDTDKEIDLSSLDSHTFAVVKSAISLANLYINSNVKVETTHFDSKVKHLIGKIESAVSYVSKAKESESSEESVKETPAS